MRRISLSEAEERVLFAMADGMRAAEIAAEFSVSPHTVKSHIKAIMRKYRAKTQAHAVAIAYHEGILVPKEVSR